MSKINNKNLIFVLLIIAILAVSVIFTLPKNAQAEFRSSGVDYGWVSEGSLAPSSANAGYSLSNNTAPIIYSISPNKINSGVGAKAIHINGANFVPGSVAKFGSQDRPTSYVNSGHLVMQLSSNDTNNAGEFLVTVENPNGADSNVSFLTIANKNGNGANTGTVTGRTGNGGNVLGANANSSGFRLSGLVLWLFIAILILVVVILWRKIFGEKEAHKPLKHA